MAYRGVREPASSRAPTAQRSPSSVPADGDYSPVPGSSAPGVLDSLSSTPRACYSIRRRLLSSYSGPLIRVRKTTGGDTTTEEDVEFVPATGLLDLVALAAFVGSESWSVVTVYDQAGGRHLTNATAAQQPVGGTTGTGVTLETFPAADLIPASSQRWARADALGLSGAIALSLWVDCSFDAVTGLPISIGTNGAGQAFYINENSTTAPKVATVGAERIFTSTNLTAGGRKRMIGRLPAGAGIGSGKLMINGSELVESGTVNPSNTVTLGTAATVLGAFLTGAAPQDGKISEAAYWNADLSAGDLAIINGLS